LSQVEMEMATNSQVEAAQHFAEENEKETSYEEIYVEIMRRLEGDMKEFLGYCDDPLASMDFETSLIFSTFDAKAGIMLDPTLVKAGV